MRTLNLDHAAAFLHISPAVLRQKAKRGEVKGAKPGKRWVFLEDDLVEYLRSLYAGAGQAPSSGCKEDTLWHSTNAAKPGGSASRTPAGSEYAALLGLKTGKRPRSITTG